MAIPSFSFLRPLAPPHPAYVRSVFRSLTTQATTSTTYTPPVAPLEYSSSSPAPSPLPSASEPLTYHVERTPAKQLPIYHINKRQGFLKQTRIRRITGNIADLKKHLQQGLKLEDGHIKINSLTKHIIIKGWRKHEVARFLKERLF